jgi:hypothetical protein
MPCGRHEGESLDPALLAVRPDAYSAFLARLDAPARFLQRNTQLDLKLTVLAGRLPCRPGRTVAELYSGLPREDRLKQELNTERAP